MTPPDRWAGEKMASYSSRVRADIARWVELGFIDSRAAEIIVADVDARERRSLSFGSILAMMAALMFGAALLLLVASNWETIPRLGRVGGLFGILFAGYVGGAVLKNYDHPAVAEAVWLVAAAAFGGSIALIGQMYHFTGDETQAIMVWCIGTMVAAAALRSGPLTVGATGLAAAWLFLVGVSFWRDSGFPYAFIGLAAALWLISYWTRSAAARHLLLLSLVFYGALLAGETGMAVGAPVLAAVFAVLFAIAVALPREAESVAQINGLLPVHGLIGFLTGIFLTQFQFSDSADAEFAMAATVGLAGIVAAVVLAGRESRGLRWIAYIGFAAELCMIYAVTIQNMLGTAGFFLAAAVILGLFALAIIRIEKRMKGPATRQGASA